MGMFDDVCCEHPLPGEPKPQTTHFQTKDLECLMEQYTITQDGRLLKEGIEVPFYGSLNFYTYTIEHMWFEYEAEFTYGRLIDIRPISIRQVEGKERRIFHSPPT